MLMESADGESTLLDYGALGGPALVRAPRLRSDASAWKGLIYRASIAGALFVGSGALFVVFLEALFEKQQEGGSTLTLIIGGVAVPAVGVFLGSYLLDVAMKLDVVRLGGPARRARLQRFAEDNVSVSFLPEVQGMDYPGFAFESAQRPEAFDVIRFESGPIEVGNLVTTGTSGNRQVALVHGYIRFPLPARLPHILAISTTDRGHSAVPVVVLRDQFLSLEGDFDKHFTLYAPHGYEQDALYVFGPDVMARLIDHADRFDVEIVDSWLQVYAHRPFNMLDPETYQLATGLAAAVASKVSRQAGRYSDNRAAAPDRVGIEAIAPAARRLRSTAPWVFVCVVVGGAIGALVAALPR
jgi:hypothetical protein